MAKKILANKEIVYREEEGEALLFDPETGAIKALNSTGNFIWKLCDGTRDKEQIVVELVKTFPDVKRDALVADLEEFLKQVSENSLVSLVD